MKTTILFTCVMCLFVLNSITRATPIFTDDFESDTVGTEPANWDSVGGTVNILVSNSGTPFGPSNQYVNYSDLSTGGLSLFKQSTAIEGIVSTFAFDYYEPSGGPNATVNIGYTTASGDINSGAAWRTSLDDGSIIFASGEVTAGTKTYSLDTAYRFYYVVNDTNASQGYTVPGVGAASLAVGEFDVYFRPLSSSALTYAGTGVNNTSLSLGRLGYRTFSTGDQVFYLDNVDVSTGAVLAIPEASSLVLLLGGLLGCGLRQRRS